MNIDKTIVVASLLGMLASAPAMATKGGFYIGGSVGGATTEFDEGGQKIDESDTAWKLFAGYHFLQFFAVEGGYRDLGTLESVGAKVSPTGWDIAGLAGIPLGPVYLFGKLGVIKWDADTNFAGDDDGTDYEAGIGASIDLWKIQLRGEVEYLDALEGSVMYTVGAAWRF